GLHPAAYPYPGQEPGHRTFPAYPYVGGHYAPRGGHEGLHPASYSYRGGEGPAGVTEVSLYVHGRGGSEEHGWGRFIRFLALIHSVIALVNHRFLRNLKLWRI
ncbi:unnamed protein product, partial [Musa acuminata subsp. burmannicoides]